MEDLVIIGGGPAGMTAALYALRGGVQAVLLEPGGCGGQLTETAQVENYPGVTASGPVLVKQMKQQIVSLGARIISERAMELRVQGPGYQVVTNAQTLEARTVILANGAKRRKLGCPGEEEFRGRGVSYCAVCDGGFFRDKPVAVIGGGNTALEDALYLAELCPKVYLIHRRDNFRGWQPLAEQVRQRENIEILWNTAVDAVFGESVVEGLCLQAGERAYVLQVEGVFVAIGVAPDNAAFAGLLPLNAEGYVLAEENCQTGVPGLFAAGDTRAKPLRQIVTATADGAVAASGALNYLREQG